MFVAQPDFGERLCSRTNTPTVNVYNHVANLSLQYCRDKHTAVESTVWNLRSQDDEWLRLPVNLCRRSDRGNFQCTADVYSYIGAPAATLVVDLANKHIGGGCFRAGFVQEEQMVMQPTDFATRLHAHRQTLRWHQGISYKGVYFDAWWPRAAAAKKNALNLADIQPYMSKPVTILAVDAPKMRAHYCRATLRMLAAKILIVYAFAERSNSPRILSGLLGDGAYRNNRPLVLLLHLLLQPHGDVRPVLFHHPVFWSFASRPAQSLEEIIVERADLMLEALRATEVTTLGEAIAEILEWDLPLSQHDMDLL